ncbi:DUF4062 domain-containing protein [Salsipaludibacter albus]|uniref:DUF4062 domain-containing protein n=1 Tax=Salsipaludibacter albus TaxID=2849650 RepID=UPI001EE433ED|nr:DUF4062 domain-containing protein [Salsipaludibacter albus]
MDIFISSVVGGYESYRDAAVEAIETLGHRAVRAEDFAASPTTPQQACLAAVRTADVVLLLVGSSYGAPQASGLSATHEEYLEAREDKPVLVFVESEVERQGAQQDFLPEVQAWSTGHFRAAYDSPEELKSSVIRALHEFQMSASAGPVDETGMVSRAQQLVETAPRTASAVLVVGTVGGPAQPVIRPAELEDPELARDLQREALFGDNAVLDSSVGTRIEIEGAV